MNSYVRWKDIRTEHVARAGGERAVEEGKQELLTEVLGHRLAEVRRARGPLWKIGVYVAESQCRYTFRAPTAIIRRRDAAEEGQHPRRSGAGAGRSTLRRRAPGTDRRR